MLLSHGGSPVLRTATPGELGIGKLKLKGSPDHWILPKLAHLLLCLLHRAIINPLKCGKEEWDGNSWGPIHPKSAPK